MFYITISNGLLEGDHKDRMGDAVWLYMWLIDKITRIDDNGLGYVLGGKPIQIDEIKGFARRTAQRYIAVLKDEGYIEVRYTPRGMVFMVTKAKKKFGRKTESGTPKVAHQTPERYAESGAPQAPVVAHHRDKSGAPNIRHISDTAAKTVQIVPPGSSHFEDVYKVLEAFKSVNSHYQTLQDNAKQYAAADRMLRIHGLEAMLKVIGILPQTNKMAFVTTITTPVELELRWDTLKAHLVKNEMAKIGRSKEREQIL